VSPAPKPFHDEDGQPPRSIYGYRVADRLVAELLGVCKGLVCDGVISDGEVTGFKRWLGAHSDVLAAYPGSVLAERVVSIMADGVVDEEERKELYELLCEVTGETDAHNEPMNLSTRHFFDAPPPAVTFDRMEFVFTGRMLYGTRKECEQAVIERGGRCQTHVTARTAFLVVGPIASKAWLQSSYGTKLLTAGELKEKGYPIHVVAEDHWIQQLDA
jgi:NAD-dependent DNA ligase